MEADPQARGAIKKWFGPAGLIAALVFIGGRLLIEPLRSVPQFDSDGMDPYGAVETYRLRNSSEPINTVILGTSVTIWGIMPEVLAEGLHAKAESVRSLGVAGGTPFEMWCMVKRNEERFAALKLAILEVNPMVLNEAMENDSRVEYELCQRASLSERLLIADPYERTVVVGEWLLPLQSVRRSLNSLFLNVVGADRGSSLLPRPDRRAYPLGGWKIKDFDAEDNMAKGVLKPGAAARRFIDRWRLSRVQDQSYRNLVRWLQSRGIAIVLHQMPVHPDVAEELKNSPALSRSYAEYTGYIHTLGVPEDAVFQHLEIAECGVPYKGMRDHTHFNQIGAKIYSRHLAAKIRVWQTRAPRALKN